MNPSVPVENRAHLAADDFGRLAAMLAPQNSIRLALDWMLALEPRPVPCGMIAQDEYSHDFLVECPGGLYLAYDST